MSNDSDELGDLELQGRQREDWIEVIEAFVSGNDR
jgi:hypothetical protein